jgi:hypothetical protein
MLIPNGLSQSSGAGEPSAMEVGAMSGWGVLRVRGCTGGAPQGGGP